SITYIEREFPYNLHYKLQAAVLKQLVHKKINPKLVALIGRQASDRVKISLDEPETVALQLALNNGWYTLINSFSGQNYLRGLSLNELKCPVRDNKDLLPGEEWEAGTASY
ncbi:MAG: hypothetical protein AAFY48_20545, partial [Bacteroidota bacterium]